MRTFGIDVRLLFAIYFFLKTRHTFMSAIVHPGKNNLGIVFQYIYTPSTTSLRILSASLWLKFPAEETKTI
ncbi:MAG: hypothetical protein DMG97_27405 [Acidobacteria bacterium]|nr:MAG: hypothetical protein DMG98_02195 [Acidobacteriota bacterium]PYV67355.1 MAG: hypothetical protein DMG97_27405 [Acidobacteriota bacterium]PYV79641.1 MAG: hypothetical protein DMG96_03440 [Acidobacteriota bacterium]